MEVLDDSVGDGLGVGETDLGFSIGLSVGVTEGSNEYIVGVTIISGSEHFVFSQVSSLTINLGCSRVFGLFKVFKMCFACAINNLCVPCI